MKLSLRCVFTLLLAAVNAAPILDPETLGVTSDQLSKFELFSQYAGAAYCSGNFHREGAKLACTRDGGSCLRVEKAQTSITHPFQLGESKTAGYVATDETNRLIIIAIQGTQLKSNPKSLVTNMNLNQKKTDLCGSDNKKDGCAIHAGFWLAVMDVKAEVTKAVSVVAEVYPDYRIVTTGHSLGGAVAALLGTMLRNDGRIVDIYTYGQPHLGGQDVSHYIQNQAPSKGNNFRITHFDDVVPQLPNHDWGNWGHFYPEFWITKKQGQVNNTDIKKVDGEFYTTKGNEGVGSAKGSLRSLRFLLGARKGVPAHRDYFGNISSCS